MASRSRRAKSKRRRPKRRTKSSTSLLWWAVPGAFVGLFLLSVLLRLNPPKPAKAPPSPVPVRVEVLNGCGKTGLAAALTRELRRRGVDVVLTGNAPTMDYDTTVVIDRGGGEAALEYVSWLLACEHLSKMSQDSPGEGDHLAVDITVIVGLDYHNLFHDHDRKWWLVP